MNFASIPVHIGSRFASFLFNDRPWADNISLGKMRLESDCSRTVSSIMSYVAARAIVMTALKVTRFAITNPVLSTGSLALAFMPLASLGYEKCSGKNEYNELSFRIIYKGAKLANLVSLVGSVAVVALGASSLIGLGGLAIATNILCMYWDAKQSAIFQ
jgi:hypothetical protein